jgi:transketolase
MAFSGQSVHIPCAFSLVEILSVLYSKHLHFNPADYKDPKRDYLVLSKGHGVMALYPILQKIGWIKDEHLEQYFKDGSLLRGLCESDIPGLEVTSGSLGHGLPIATGIALGLKRRNLSNKVFCIVGDGEMNEGTMWESCLFAGHHKLDNLTIIVDANEFQAMGRTEHVIHLEPLTEKFQSFGFLAKRVEGHDINALDSAFSEMSKVSHQPKALIASTTKGKGISFMEGENQWHYTRLNEETLERALKELYS